MSSRPLSSRPKPPADKKDKNAVNERQGEDRYRNLKPSTILRRLAAGLSPTDEMIALEFIGKLHHLHLSFVRFWSIICVMDSELNTKEVLQSEHWLTLPRRYVKLVLARPQLNCPEVIIQYPVCMNDAMSLGCWCDGRLNYLMLL
jgi:hypothetical protein